jgi:SAM-dependent methyltransferase
MLGTSLSHCICPACGTSSPRDVVRVPDREYGLAWHALYAMCLECRTSFQHPMPEEGKLVSFYPADYHSAGRRGLLTRIRYDMRIRRLETFVGAEGAILDYGCGDGSFLLRAATCIPGRKFFGYEISNQPQTTELADGAVTIVRGSISNLLKVLPTCSLITMNHVIEHLPDPLETLSRLRERLAPRGLLEGQTPAAASLEHRVFGMRWSGYHAPRHTVVFSRDGLRRFLERAGFDNIEVRGAFNPAALAVSIASLTKHAGAPSKIPRKGLPWLFCLGLATALAPIDLFSGAPGVVNFRAQRPVTP